MPTALVFAVQPGGAAGGLPFTTQPVVRMVDADGALVGSASGAVTISLATNPSGGALAGTATVTAAAGVAAFTDLALDKVGTYALTATAEGLAPATSAAFDVTPGAPDQLAFTTQPGGASGGTPFGTQPVVEVLDAVGNRTTGAQVSVTVVLHNGSGSQLTGSTTVMTTSGVARFTDLAIDKVGSGYVLTAAASGLAEATSAAFDVTLGAPHHLAFATQPAGATGGTPFATQPVVEVLDAGGNRAAGPLVNVGISLGTNPGGGPLRGTTLALTATGLATFSDLAIDKVGSGYTLLASLDSISVTSTTFDVTVGPATALRFVAQPQDGWDTGAPLDSQPSIEVIDAGANRVTTAADTVALSIGTNPSGGTLSGTTSRTATAGMVVFTNVSVNRSGAGYTLAASAPGRSSATSEPFTVRRWTGQIQVAVTTTGLNLDPDGYVVQVDSRPSRALAVNGTTLLDSVPPGAHHLSLSGAAFNCTLGDTTSNVSVQSGLTSQVGVTAMCGRYLSNEVLIESEEVEGWPEVFVMNPDGSGRARIGSGMGRMAAASPDGLTIAFSSYTAGQGFGIYLMGADGAGVRKLVQRSSYDGRPAWSPDGNRVAFESLNEGTDGAYDRIWLVNADGTGLRQVSPDTGSTLHVFDSAPTWFPDGHRILYNRSGRLFIVDADDGGVSAVELPDSLFPVNAPRLSPDGSRVAFVSPVPAGAANDDIYMANVDGSNVVRLTQDPAADETPVWSPDGTQLLFARVVDGKTQICIMDVTVGGGTRLGPVVTRSELPNDWARGK